MHTFIRNKKNGVFQTRLKFMSYTPCHQIYTSLTMWWFWSVVIAICFYCFALFHLASHNIYFLSVHIPVYRAFDLITLLSLLSCSEQNVLPVKNPGNVSTNSLFCSSEHFYYNWCRCCDTIRSIRETSSGSKGGKLRTYKSHVIFN